MTPAPKPTLVDLDGEVTELQALERVAPACDCTIEPGPGQKFGWLGGAMLDAATTPQQARERASKLLVLLNGLARLQNPQHRNVELANEVYQNGNASCCVTAMASTRRIAPRDSPAPANRPAAYSAAG